MADSAAAALASLANSGGGEEREPLLSNTVWARIVLEQKLSLFRRIMLL